MLSLGRSGKIEVYPSKKHAVLIIKGNALSCSTVSCMDPERPLGFLVNAGVGVGCGAGA